MNAAVTLLNKVPPATVGINAQVDADHPSAQILGTERQGSGVIVDPGDLVLTVNYVILGARELKVTLLGGDLVGGTVVAQDFASGIAVIRLSKPGPRALPLGSSAELRTGDDVFIVAAAGDGQRRASDGVVTSLDRFDAHWEYSLERAILTTAMNPGVGGGALVDVHGRVAGLVSLDLGEVGRLTLAIPAECYLDHRDELLQHGHCACRPPRAWIGLYCYTFREHVVIAGMLPGTPGERAGLKAGDVVIGVDGERVRGRQELYAAIWKHRPGEAIDLRIFRNNEVRQLAVTGADAQAFFA
jgi:S1-C subfamily serine protease